MGVFTSDVFLKAFALARRAEPLYGAQMWIVRRALVKMAECSPWNGFIEDADPAGILETAREHGAWTVTFTCQDMIEDSRFQMLPPTPTLLTFPDFVPDQKLRRKLKKAAVVKPSIEHARSREMQELLLRLWGKLGRAIPNDFYSILEEGGVGHTLLAKIEGKAAAGLFYITDYDGANYMYSLATDAAHRGTEITSFLVYSFLLTSFENHAPYVDLCGASIPAVYVFKKRFSTTIAWRPRYIAVLNPLWKIVNIRAKYIYADQSSHIPEKKHWRRYLVKDLIGKRTSDISPQQQGSNHRVSDDIAHA